MEMLVALTLFSLVVTISTDLFFTFQRTSRKTENLENLVASARLMMEQIVREMRQGTIDYRFYADRSILLGAQPIQTTLALRGQDGGQVQFEFSGDTSTLTMRRAGIAESLNSAGILVCQASFSIAPVSNPFEFVAAEGDPRSGQFRTNTQPRVTVFFSLGSTEESCQSNRGEYALQTTISSRQYAR